MDNKKTRDEGPNWPGITQFQRLHASGWGEVIPIRGTNQRIERGLRSSISSIVYSYEKHGEGTAMCMGCKRAELHPGPPKGSAGPGAPKTPLFTPDTRAFAVYTLTWLNKFFQEHKKCQ